MPVIHAIILGIVQGFSEFLPISSSGHLIIVPELFGWTELTDNPSLNKTFDVALHLGTLIAALWYFRREVLEYVVAAFESMRARAITTDTQRLAWLLLLSSVPGAILGAALTGFIEDELGDPILIGVNLIVFALVLDWADRAPMQRPQRDFRRRDAVLMGTAQAVALSPGVSRSGVTISAARGLRFDREAADAPVGADEPPDHRWRGHLQGRRTLRPGRHPGGLRRRVLLGRRVVPRERRGRDHLPAAVRPHTLVPAVRRLPLDHRVPGDRHLRHRSAVGARTSRHDPLSDISPSSTVMPAAPPGSHRTSVPTCTTSCSMRWSVDAIVSSRTGSAS